MLMEVARAYQALAVWAFCHHAAIRHPVLTFPMLGQYQDQNLVMDVVPVWSVNGRCSGGRDGRGAQALVRPAPRGPRPLRAGKASARLLPERLAYRHRQSSKGEGRQ